MYVCVKSVRVINVLQGGSPEDENAHTHIHMFTAVTCTGTILKMTKCYISPRAWEQSPLRLQYCARLL